MMDFGRVARLLVMFVELCICITGVSIGTYFQSSMLVGDALRKFIQFLVSFAHLWAKSMTSRAPTDQFSYGYLRASSVATLFSGSVFLCLAVMLGIEAITRFIILEYMKVPSLTFTLASMSVATSIVKRLAVPSAHRKQPFSMGDTAHDSPDIEGVIHSTPTDREEHVESQRMPRERLASLEGVTRDHQSRSNHGGATGTNRHRRLNGDEPIHPSSFRQHITESAFLGDSDSDESDRANIYTEEQPLLRGSGSASEQRYVLDSPLKTGALLRQRKEAKESHKRDIWDLGDLFWGLGLLTASFSIWKYPHSAVEYLDPALALVASFLALGYAFPTIIESSQILFNAAPDIIRSVEICHDLEALQGVVNIHHLHIWTLDGQRHIASMIVEVGHEVNPGGWNRLSKEIRTILHSHDMHSATLEPKFTDV